MIKHWFITGDTHGRVFDRLNQIDFTKPNDENAVIILGDAGLNFYLNKTDIKEKNRVNDKGVWVYCVHGNHEEYPANIDTMKLIYDDNVKGEVFYEEDFPMIRYFIDGGEYMIDGHSTLVVGGAYSIDKEYRQKKYMQGDGWCGWFASEIPTESTLAAIKAKTHNKHYDIVLSHTCPISWEPIDLFLSFVDQRTVDKTMELFLYNLIHANGLTFNYWYFGHYHDDRLVRPGVEMYYTNIEELNKSINRWKEYKETGELSEWWLKKGPTFYEKEV